MSGQNVGGDDKPQYSLPNSIASTSTLQFSRLTNQHSWSTENLLASTLSRPAPLSSSSLISSLSQLPTQTIDVPTVATTNILIPALFRQQLLTPPDFNQQLLLSQIRSLSSGNIAAPSSSGIASPLRPKAASSNLSLSLPSLMQDSEGASSSRASAMSIDSGADQSRHPVTSIPIVPPIIRPIARRPSVGQPIVSFSSLLSSGPSTSTATTSAPSIASDSQTDQASFSQASQKNDEKTEQGIKKVEAMKSEHKSLPELFKQHRPQVNNYDAGTIPATGYVPSHFMKGTMIKLANGKMKKVENLSSDDFLSSAAISTNAIVNASIVVNIVKGNNLVRIHFEVGESRYKTTLDVQKEYPFFVLGKGWSSGDPTMTMDRYGIEAQNLNVGDVCIVLTRKTENESTVTTTLVQAEKHLQKELKRRAPKRKVPETIKIEDIPEENVVMYEI